MPDETTINPNGQSDHISADKSPQVESNDKQSTGFAIDRARVERANVRLTEMLREPNDGGTRSNGH